MAGRCGEEADADLATGTGGGSEAEVVVHHQRLVHIPSAAVALWNDKQVPGLEAQGLGALCVRLERHLSGQYEADAPRRILDAVCRHPRRPKPSQHTHTHTSARREAFPCSHRQRGAHEGRTGGRASAARHWWQQ
jgi:hypothetical protein